ncbi:T9SS type A sorting domain-containing protein [Hymenobacter rubidus]|uniref:T9SS type A sorting domain-containing protein n=1 Tax=Hymenobacter rubidus TaxID=1441626 RepID=UPI00191FCE8B|nr:T9SS type A sorting domain-containing protein [Hymenobacter rubidus]
MRPFFLLLLLLASQQAFAQSITAYQLLPANASANDNLKLVLTVFHGGCGGNFGYSVNRTATTLAITGCYPAVVIAMPCVTYDTVRLGRLPAGSYSISTVSHIATSAAGCDGSTITPPGQPNAVGNFTVGLALATRAAVPIWQVAPTILPATASTLCLTNASKLQQISIYDLTGREKARFTAAELAVQSNQTQVPLPALEPAMYLLRVVDATGQTSTQRFLRQ